MVKGQVYLLQIALGILREQAPGRHVYADHLLGLVSLRSQQALQIGGKDGGELRVGQDIRLLPLLPQGGTKGGGTAHRVPVGAHMGENQVAVSLQQPLGGLLIGQRAHSSSSWSSP